MWLGAPRHFLNTYNYFGSSRRCNAVITSFEVGSVFQIVDKASPVISRLSKEVADFAKLVADTRKELQSLGRVSFKGLADNLKLATDQTAKLAGTVDKTSADITAATNRATLSVRELAREFQATAVAARSVGTAANASAIASGARNPRNVLGSGGSGSGVHYRPGGLPVPGGHVSGSGVGFVAAAAAAYSAAEGLEAGDIVSRRIANVFPEGSPADLAKKKKELTDAILKEARITALPLKTVGKMALDEIKTNANQPWDARMRMLPLVIESAAREAYIKDVNPDLLPQHLLVSSIKSGRSPRRKSRSTVQCSASSQAKTRIVSSTSANQPPITHPSPPQ